MAGNQKQNNPCQSFIPDASSGQNVDETTSFLVYLSCTWRSRHTSTTKESRVRTKKLAEIERKKSEVESEKTEGVELLTTVIVPM